MGADVAGASGHEPGHVTPWGSGRRAAPRSILPAPVRPPCRVTGRTDAAARARTGQPAFRRRLIPFTLLWSAVDLSIRAAGVGGARRGAGGRRQRERQTARGPARRALHQRHVLGGVVRARVVAERRHDRAGRLLPHPHRGVGGAVDVVLGEHAGAARRRRGRCSARRTRRSPASRRSPGDRRRRPARARRAIGGCQERPGSHSPPMASRQAGWSRSVDSAACTATMPMPRAIAAVSPASAAGSAKCSSSTSPWRHGSPALTTSRSTPSRCARAWSDVVVDRDVPAVVAQGCGDARRRLGERMPRVGVAARCRWRSSREGARAGFPQGPWIP